ncbi:MAG TPA: RdgB/HAM1 family non-canonical purine NTP pyrophosphatase [Anaerolineales bacterium]|nr:RdgB/HAM1 family non-canonical purine NTP pyrophosphatase [Anaerolineales bacterium]
MQSLLIATNNKGKMAEMQALLAGLSAGLVTPAQCGIELEVNEDGKTYAENAQKKAMAFARISGLISLADDSGLEVDALDGAPGLHSHRYVPAPGATDADRRRYLLGNLAGKARPWPARFRAAIAIAVPGGSVQVIEGECRGEIIPEERGSSGFGYDPIFFIPEMGKTMAELEMDEKNRISHRARAVMKARPILETLFREA